MSNERNTIKEQHERYIYARDNGHLRYLEKARKCEEFYAGRQWDSATKARLARLRRPALTMNKVLPGIAAIQGEQLNNRVDVAFRATSTGDPDTAAALDKLYLQIMNANNYDAVESYMFDDAIITSRGYVDVRMNYDHNIRGEVQIELVNPLNIMLDPDAEEYEPGKWKELFYTKWLSLEDIKRLYGRDIQGALKGKKSSTHFGYDFIDERQSSFGGADRFETDAEVAHRRRLRLIERQYKEMEWREHFVDTTTGDSRPINPKWDRDRIQLTLDTLDGVTTMRRKTECVKWVATIDDVMIHDEKSPYRSLTVAPYFPFFRKGDTIGLVENMIDPQEFYNKTLSQELHIVNSSANGGWKVKNGSLKNMDPDDLQERGSETGLVMVLDETDDAEKIQPNQVPSGLDRVIYTVGEDLKEVSMVSDSQRGFDRADVAAKAIQAKKASGSVNFAKPLSNLLLTRKWVGKLVLECVQDFYTEERTYVVTGGGIQPKTEEVTINQVDDSTPEGRIINDVGRGKYETVVTAVPARTEFEDTQFEEGMRMKEAGIQVPDHVLIEHSHLNRKQELAEEIKQRNGWGDPSEMEQQAAQLENQIKELEAAKLDAENKKIESETVLNLVRAQETAEGEDGEGADQQATRELIAQQEQALMEARIKKYEIDQNLQLKRQEMIATLKLQRERMQGEMEIKREAAKAQAEAQAKAAAAKPKPQPAGKK